MSTPQRKARPPQFELRWGGLHLTVQRIPVWLITAASAGGTALTAWWARK